MVSPFASVSRNILHPLEKKVVSPVQACNNHLCCERSLLLYQTVRADFCLASAYCLLAVCHYQRRQILLSFIARPSKAISFTHVFLFLCCFSDNCHLNQKRVWVLSFFFKAFKVPTCLNRLDASERNYFFSGTEDNRSHTAVYGSS